MRVRVVACLYYTNSLLNNLCLLRIGERGPAVSVGDKRAVSSKKVPNVLSRCHTKRSMGKRGQAHPSFGMTPTF